MGPENRKICDCHSEPMFWAKRKDRKFGGTWRCRIKLRECAKRHRLNHLEQEKERARVKMRKHYYEIIRKDPIKMLKSNTRARMRYRKKVEF